MAWIALRPRGKSGGSVVPTPSLASRIWVTGMVVAALAAATAVKLAKTVESSGFRARAQLEASVLDRDIEFLESRVELDPHNYMLSGHLSDLYARRFRTSAEMRDVTRAEELAHQALITHPDSGVAFGRLAQRLLTQHRFAEAYSAAALSTAGPEPGEYELGVLVDAARAVGAYAEADSALAKIPAGSLTAALREGQGSEVDGSDQRAMRRLTRACDRIHARGLPLETQAWCLTRLAALEHRIHGPEGAKTLLERALNLNPGDRGAVEELADLAYGEGEWRKARRLYEEIVAPAHPDLYLRLAEVAHALGRSEEARGFERRFVELAVAPEAEPLNGIELALFESGRPSGCERAESLATRELSRRSSSEAFEAAAWIRYRCGSIRSSEDALREAQVRAGLSESGRLLQGLLLRRRGEDEVGSAIIAEASRAPTLLDPVALMALREMGYPGGVDQ